MRYLTFTKRICDISHMQYISQVRYIAYVILKTKKKKSLRASNNICTVKHRESDKPRGRKNAYAILPYEP